MHYLRTAVATLALPAGLACADCPVASDLPAGIVIFQSDGTTLFRDVFYGPTPGLIGYYAMEDDRVTYQELAARGLYVLTYTDFYEAPFVTASIDYPVGMDSLPKPVAGLQWAVDVHRVQGATRTAEHQDYAFGEVTPMQIGACTYASIPVQGTTTTADGATAKSVLQYLPELGISVVYALEIDGEMETIFHPDGIGLAADWPGSVQK